MNNKNKKGQVTLFIIIGLIILVALNTFFFYKAYMIPDSIQNSEGTTKVVQEYVQSCVDAVAEDAVFFIAKHGGYYELPEKADASLELPYYFYEGQNIMPEKEDIEEQLTIYVKNELFFCIKLFGPLREQGYIIMQQTPEVVVGIEKNQVNFHVEYPLTITKESITTTLSSFTAQVPERLHALYSIAEEFMKIQEQDVDSLCITCLVTIGKAYDARVMLYSVGEGVIEFSFIDNNKEESASSVLEHHFLNKYSEYSCSNLPPDASEEFIALCFEEKLKEYYYTVAIEKIPVMTAKVGVEFSYTVVATGVELTYTAATSLFAINAETGEIIFIPEESDIGEHTIWIHVKDNIGNEAYNTLIITVED